MTNASRRRAGTLFFVVRQGAEVDIAMDKIDLQILNALQQDARISYRALGRRVAMSSPAAAERVRKLEVAKIIKGYHAQIDPGALGYQVQALMTVTYPSHLSRRMYKLAQATPEIVECLHVSGHGSVVLRVLARSTKQLEQLMLRVQQIGTTETSIVLSVPFRRTALEVARDELG
jgi:Lrp/AsnC family leucine-responsive transcriptional regulator